MSPCRRVLLLPAALLAFSACSDKPAEKKATAPVPVTTASASLQDIPISLDLVGRTEAFESVTLKARVDGQVASVRFQEGQHVDAGQILLELDPADFKARLNQAEANAARNAALLAKARADTERYIALKNRNFISEEKLNDVRTNETAIAASLRADKAAIELARTQLAYATIRVPFAGIVGARLVFPGSAVKTNDTLLAVVNRVRPLLVAFSLPEKHLPRIRAAMAKDGAPPSVDVTLPGASTVLATGEVRFLDNAVDGTTGTVLMKATLPNDDERLLPGQFVNVSLRLQTLQQTVTVPDQAIQQGPDGAFVFVVRADGSAEVRKVDVAAAYRGRSAIAKGLQAGETVVTDGQLRLTPGAMTQAVTTERPTGDTSTATAPSAAGSEK